MERGAEAGDCRGGVRTRCSGARSQRTSGSDERAEHWAMLASLIERPASCTVSIRKPNLPGPRTDRPPGSSSTGGGILARGNPQIDLGDFEADRPARSNEPPQGEILELLRQQSVGPSCDCPGAGLPHTDRRRQAVQRWPRFIAYGATVGVLRLPYVANHSRRGFFRAEAAGPRRVKFAGHRAGCGASYRSVSLCCVGRSKS